MVKVLCKGKVEVLSSDNVRTQGVEVLSESSPFTAGGSALFSFYQSKKFKQKEENKEENL